MASDTPMHVLIIGGGLGGLCLAQGLRQAGIDVAIYERDATPLVRRQGYRLHLDARGATGLRSCLPSHLFELFLATTSQQGRQVTVLNKRLKTLQTLGSEKAASDDPAHFSTAVDRLTLREILLAHLDDVVSFGKEFSHYEIQPDGSVQAFFVDGSEAHGDVLVAADGVHSRVRRQLLPHASAVDTNQRCIYGKTLLTEATRPLIPASLQRGFTVVAGPPFTLALGLVEFLQPPIEAAAQLAPAVQFHSSGSYLMWAFNAQQARLGVADEELFQMESRQLQLLVSKKIKSWHPNLSTLIAASEPEETFPIAVRVATPCDPWQSTPVTLLGDAIHAMSPAGGSGANMALLDAHLLCQTLISVARKEKPLLPAIHEYEAQMLKAGFEAARFSANGGILKASPPAKKPLLARFVRSARHPIS